MTTINPSVDRTALAAIVRATATFVGDTYSGEWAADASSTLESDADRIERGEPCSLLRLAGLEVEAQPEPAIDRAAVLLEANAWFEQHGVSRFYGHQVATELRRMAAEIAEARQPEPEMPSVDVDPVYGPRAWETYRRDAGCGCTAPAPVACTIPHGTGAWLCVCHRLSGPPWKDGDPGRPLTQQDAGIRQYFQEPNRCTSANGMFRCARPTGHLGDHRMGRTFWSRRPDDTVSAAPGAPETEA